MRTLASAAKAAAICAYTVAGAALALAQVEHAVETVAAVETIAAEPARLPGGAAAATGDGIAGGLCAQPSANCQLPNEVAALNSNGTTFRTADDFDVAVNGNLTGLCWSGVYVSGTTDCSGTAVDAFVVRVYDDNNGVPGVLRGTFVQGASLTVLRAGSGRTFGAANFPIIEYSATLAGPALLAANCYWLEITNSLTGCTWFWESGAGGGDYASAVQDGNNSYALSDVVQSDQSLCVNLALQDPSIQPCAPSAPANDACAQAQALTLNVPVAVDLRGATSEAADPEFSCLSGGAGPGVASVWYSFVAAAPAQLVSTCGSGGGDSIVAVYTGTCGVLTQIACNDDACDLRSEMCVEPLTPGTTYYVQLAAYNDVARTVYTLVVGACVSCQSHDPVGDYITSASFNPIVAAWDDFQPGETGSVTTMTLQASWWNGQPGAASRAAEPLAADENFTLRVFRQGGDSLPGTPVATRSRSAGTLTFVHRSATTGFFEQNGVPNFQDNFDPSIFDYVVTFDPIALEAGVCYWLTIQNSAVGADNAARFRWLGGMPAMMSAGNNRRAFDAMDDGVDATEIRTGDRIWCLDLPMNDAASCVDTTPPPNDACADATVVACGGAPIELIASLQNATAEASDPTPSCFGVPAEGTVWYRVTTGAAPASFLVETCPSTFAGLKDSILAVYTAGPGSCPAALTEVACANDNCGEAVVFEELRVDPALPNTTYYVMLGAADDLAQLSYRIRLSCPAPPTPPNDRCASAAPLTIGVPAPGTMLNATLDEDAIDAGTCDLVTVAGKGVWHTIVGNGSTLRASLCSLTGMDTRLSVFCSGCDSLTCVAGDDDGCGAVQSAARVQWCAKSNATYHILVHTALGDAGGAYELIVSDVGPGGCVPDPDCPAAPVCPGPVGDANCDGLINFFDIDPFVFALFDLPGYRAQFCGGADCAADTNCDGLVNFFDINSFIECIINLNCPGCPP